MRAEARRRGLELQVDSAGTADYHVGDPPDERAVAEAAEHGVDISTLRGRQIKRPDLAGDRPWDHVFVMDKANLHDTLAVDPDGDHGTRVRLFREFDPEPGDYQVPDPYYGGAKGFEHVIDIVERTAAAILDRLVAVYDLEPKDA